MLIVGYFKTCDKQSEKLNRGSYQYTTRDYVTIYFNNTLASFSRSLREFKEKAYEFMYDIGTWLKEIYESLTERPATHNHYTPKEKPLVEEIEMKELNCTYKPFQTPPIHPQAEVLVPTSQIKLLLLSIHLKLPQQDRSTLKYVVLE